jgi:hypothetical protein
METAVAMGHSVALLSSDVPVTAGPPPGIIAGEECQFYVSIAGIAISIHGGPGIRLSAGLQDFRISPVNAAVNISVRWAKELHPRTESPVFDPAAMWTLFRSGPDLFFDFRSPAFGPAPYGRMRVGREFDSAEILLNHSLLRDHVPVDPLQYPADELLLTNHLATGLGVEVHGCGMIDPEQGGFLFLGHSGAGKSTTTRLWKSVRNPKILSDDRIILRIHNGELWMYGTPWHGEAAFACPEKARIKRIFVLQHGTKDEFTQIARSGAVGELFARCFPPFHSAEGLTNTLEFLHRVVDLVTCYDFSFVPNASAVEAALAFGS